MYTPITTIKIINIHHPLKFPGTFLNSLHSLLPHFLPFKVTTNLLPLTTD